MTEDMSDQAPGGDGVASTRREKELARLRAERQAARRAEAAARRKRRATVIASATAVALVAAAATYIGLSSRDGDDTTASPSPSPSGPCTYEPSGEPSKPVEAPPATPTATGPVTATMTTDQGVVTWSLLTDRAPCASNSMISLAGQGYYDGTPCHRLTTESIFVLQCGDPLGTGQGGPGYQFAEENLEGATYPRGTLAMAKTSEPGTSGSQFFLVYQDTQLPPEYTPFGTITGGLEVLDKVAAAGATEDPTTGNTAPNLKVNIQTLTTAPA